MAATMQVMSKQPKDWLAADIGIGLNIGILERRHYPCLRAVMPSMKKPLF
jgi:hypothetical protein